MHIIPRPKRTARVRARFEGGGSAQLERHGADESREEKGPDLDCARWDHVWCVVRPVRHAHDWREVAAQEDGGRDEPTPKPAYM